MLESFLNFILQILTFGQIAGGILDMRMKTFLISLLQQSLDVIAKLKLTQRLGVDLASTLNFLDALANVRIMLLYIQTMEGANRTSL